MVRPACKGSRYRAAAANPLAAQKAGVITSPSDLTAAPNVSPAENLELARVIGYRSRACSNNVRFLGSRLISYHAAGLGITLNLDTKEQEFFVGHTDDVTAFSTDVERKLVVTGQTGKDPLVCVWSLEKEPSQPVRDNTYPPCSSSYAKVHQVNLGAHLPGVAASGLTRDGRYLVAVASNLENDVFVYDMVSRIPEPALTGSANHAGVYDITFHPSEPRFVTAGARGLKFWSIDSRGLSSKVGVFGSSEGASATTAVTYIGDNVVTGHANGDVKLWEGNRATRTISGAHDASVFSIAALPGSRGFATAGKDGRIKTWTSEWVENGEPIEVPLRDSVRALDVNSSEDRGVQAVIGTAMSRIYIIDLETGKLSLIVDGHDSLKGHETWGLAVDQGKGDVVTCGDDSSVRVWNKGDLVPSALLRDGRKRRFRAVDIHGRRVAVGCDDGGLLILSSDTLQEVNCIQVTKSNHNRGVGVVRFSPDGYKLAVGTFEMNIRIYDTSSWSEVARCTGHTSSITSIDWSQDSLTLRSNSADYELLFHRASDGTHIIRSDDTKDVAWASASCTICWEALGMWRIGMDGTDINDCDAFGKLIVNGNDFGALEFFAFPAPFAGNGVQRIGKSIYGAHSSHVVGVKFAQDGKRVYSVGGLDGCLMEWRVLC